MNDRELLKQSILSTLDMAHEASGGNEIAARCPFCGDSQSDRTKKSFYISFNNDEPMMYICFRASCGVKGILDRDALNIFGIFDLDSNVAITRENRRLMENPSYRFIKDKDIYVLNNYNSLDKIQQMKHKMDYISDRIGYTLQHEDLSKLKISLSLIELLKSNNIKDITRHPNIVKQLDKHFVGFISQDNAFLNLRQVTGQGEVWSAIDKRYNIYNIFNRNNNKDKIYTIPTSIDLVDPRPKRINITEGVFDILSVYFNMTKDIPNSIHTAVGGTGFVGALKSFIINYKLMNLEIHIYKDNDMKDNFINFIVNTLRPFGYPIYLHWNSYPGEKDFGVPKNKIKENIKRLA